MTPGYIDGKPVNIGVPGPDGWYGMVDEYALGLRDGENKREPFTARSLWCNPGGGYSYATASIHIVSIILRKVTGMELEDYIRNISPNPWAGSTGGLDTNISRLLIIRQEGEVYVSGVQICCDFVILCCTKEDGTGSKSSRQIILKWPPLLPSIIHIILIVFSSMSIRKGNLKIPHDAY